MPPTISKNQQLLEYLDLVKLGIRFSRTQIWRKTRDGTFPAPVKIGANFTAWRRRDVERWMNNLDEVKPKPKKRRTAWR